MSSRPLPRAEVYSLKERCWREVDDDATERVLNSCDVPRRWTQCFVDGTIYWPAKSKVGSESHCILAFNVNDERFSRIELPKELPRAGLVSISETKVTGLLTVLYHKARPRYHSARACEVLLMKSCSGSGEEDRWVRFCSITPEDYCDQQIVIGVWRDNKVLLEKHRKCTQDELQQINGLGDTEELCLYDRKTREIERLGLPGVGIRGRGAAYAADYAESLVLLEPEFGASPYRDPVKGFYLTRSDNWALEDAHWKWSVKRFDLIEKGFTFV